MAKPRLIIIVRHAQSEGNKNREIHQTVPDHRVKLTSDGWQQAYEAGRRMRDMLRADDTLQFFTSPYRRTRETTEGILQTLTSDDPEPSPFKRNNIKVYEEPRLREQDFGNFQPCGAEMERMWQERADYGHFFYRIPNGESAADAYDRVSGFNESLWRQFGEDDFPSVCVLVTHGLMSRVFLMKWYHFSVEYFEDLRNINHCEFLIMRKQEESGKYSLENKLRTWSELRRERAALLKQKEQENGTTKDKDAIKLDKAAALIASPSSTSIVPQRRWGGCPNGCNHDKNFKIRSGLADLIKRDGTAIYDDNNSNGGGAKSPVSPAHAHALAHAHDSHATHGNHSNHASGNTSVGHHTPSQSRRSTTASRRFQSVGYSDDDDGGDEIDDDNRASSPVSVGSSQSDQGREAIKPPADAKNSGTNNSTAEKGGRPRAVDVKRALEEMVSSPDATPSFITPEDRLRAQTPNKSPPGPKTKFLHVGRDFGGTYSGHTSDADSSEDDRMRERMARLKLNTSVDEDDDEDENSYPHHHHYVSPSGAAVEDPSFRGTGHAVSGTDEKTGKSSRSTGGNGSAKTTSGGNGNGNAAAASAHARRKRTKNMANRLGDAPHCSDCEHAGGGLTEDEMDMDDQLIESGTGDGDETDVDHELRREEEEDRSIRGSVY